MFKKKLCYIDFNTTLLLKRNPVNILTNICNQFGKIPKPDVKCIQYKLFKSQYRHAYRVDNSSASQISEDSLKMYSIFENYTMRGGGRRHYIVLNQNGRSFVLYFSETRGNHI